MQRTFGAVVKMATSIRVTNVVRLILLVSLASLLYQIFLSSNEKSPRIRRDFRRPKFNRKKKHESAMASQHLKNIASRRSIYALSKESTVSDTRLQEILTETLKHTPSSFNNQAPRAVLLLGVHHDTLWEIARDTVQTKLPQQAYDSLKPKLEGYGKGYGTIMFFIDEETMEPFKDSHPEMPFDQWSEHSQGKHSRHFRQIYQLTSA